jgi:phage terminase large subunit-like protein
MSFAGRLAHELTSGWQVTARPNQLPPVGDWAVWLMLAGRGFGKTRVLSEMTNIWATSKQAGGIAVVAATAADARDVMVEGESGILECAVPWCRPVYQATRRRLEWPNGALAYLYSAEEPDRLRGPQHDAAICDELASWRDPSTWDMLMFGLRLGQRPRTIVATTPRPTRLIRELLLREGGDVVVTRGSTYENRANLAPGFFDQVIRKYEGTRLGRQELLAEVLLDVPGALWKLEDIDKARRERVPELQRIVVAVDPAVSSHEGSDETGIIVVGKDDRGHGYVLEDLSGRYAPDDWARAAISAYHRHSADRIVAEVNQGGALVEATLRTIDGNIPYTGVHASRGKYVRAEPVSAMYQQGRVHHCGHFAGLEDQLLSFVPDMDRGRQGSPDRADAAIWGLSQLLIEPEKYAGLFEYYRQEVARVREEAASDEKGSLSDMTPGGPQQGDIDIEVSRREAVVLAEPALLMPTRTLGGGRRIRWVG